MPLPLPLPLPVPLPLPLEFNIVVNNDIPHPSVSFGNSGQYDVDKLLRIYNVLFDSRQPMLSSHDYITLLFQ